MSSPLTTRHDVLGDVVVAAGDRDAPALARALGAARALPLDAPSPALLARRAAERGAGLLVVDRRRHAGLRARRWDVPRELLRRARCPVAVASPGFAVHAEAPRQIAVGYDGSPEAAAAVRLAAELAERHGAALTIHVAWEQPSWAVVAYTPVPDAERLRADEHARAQRLLGEALAGLPASTAGRVHHGAPAAVLEEVSENVDLLLVGSRGHGRFERLALGSTADALVHHAACPVVVVPRPALARRTATASAPAGPAEAAA